jgi:hypothetical protein
MRLRCQCSRRRESALRSAALDGTAGDVRGRHHAAVSSSETLQFVSYAFQACVLQLASFHGPANQLESSARKTRPTRRAVCLRLIDLLETFC